MHEMRTIVIGDPVVRASVSLACGWSVLISFIRQMEPRHDAAVTTLL